MRETAPSRRGYRDALASREFRVLFSATTVSILGSVVATVALTVLVYERTGSPFLSSLAFALGFLPYAVSGFLLSAVVDRVPPRLLLSGSDLACALLVGLMARPGTSIAALLGVWLLDAGQQRRLVKPIAAAGFVPYLAFLLQPPIGIALLPLARGSCPARPAG